MQNVLSFVKDIPVLMKTYLSVRVFEDIYQLIAIRCKRMTKLFPIEVHVVEHCNLNCRGCNHFSCIAEEGFLDLEAFEKDFGRLAEISKKYFAIKILGGEPLLHPQITKFFDIARSHFPTTRIQITTNGILLPGKDEEFWNNCKKNRIVISVSQYPIKLDKKTINGLGKKYGVKIEYTGSSDPDRMCKLPIDLSGSQDIEKSFRKCAISWGCCVTLRDGKLFTCCIVAHSRFFNEYFKQNLEVGEHDYVDIYKVKNREEIIDFLQKPFPFCRYCNTSETRFGQRWEVSAKDITEWVD